MNKLYNVYTKNIKDVILDECFYCSKNNYIVEKVIEDDKYIIDLELIQAKQDNKYYVKCKLLEKIDDSFQNDYYMYYNTKYVTIKNKIVELTFEEYLRITNNIIII